MKINDIKRTTKLLKLSVSGLVIASFFAYSVPVIAADPHEHHHHHHAATSADADAIVRSQASYKIPDVKMVESNGREVLLSKTIRSDKPLMLNFIFTTCTAICPVMSAAFSQVAQQLDAEHKSVQLVSISVDPEQDTPAKLNEYAQKFGAGSQWRLFTGTVKNSIATQQAFDAYRGDKMNHAPVTLIRGANSKKWVRVEGLASAAELIKEFRGLPAI